MRDVKFAFNQRLVEMNEYFDLLHELITKESKILLHDGQIKKTNVILSTTMKSTAFLLLYNLIESTIYNLLQEIHDSLNNQGVTYDELNEQLQLIWIEYKIGNTAQPRKVTTLSQKAITKILNKEIINIDLEEYMKIRKLFSGNLDARKIKELMLSYGCTITSNIEGELILIVKNLRNKIAHGEVSFSIASKDIVMSKLERIKTAVINFLKDVIGSVEHFINNKIFMNADALVQRI